MFSAGGAPDDATANALKRIRLNLARGNLADMLELYYWSKEPGFTQLIRAIATMPEGTRAALEAFIMLARDAKSVSASLDLCGVLTFCSIEATRSAALAQRAAADEADEAPRLLN